MFPWTPIPKYLKDTTGMAAAAGGRKAAKELSRKGTILHIMEYVPGKVCLLQIHHSGGVLPQE